LTEIRHYTAALRSDLWLLSRPQQLKLTVNFDTAGYETGVNKAQSPLSA